MYRLEWIERLKLRGNSPGTATPWAISPVVLSLGLTSALTDISSEMVNSLLPAYVVLHLHLSPLQFGVIDGLYNGFAIALLSLVAGLLADRLARQKEVALAGYGISGLCKLLLLAFGTTYSGLLLVVGFDRLGKGIRSAPRDALISLNTPATSYASAFSVHRAMDACGSLLGPVVAFLLLAALPMAFDAIWVTSFVFAALGVAALWLFVPPSSPRAASPIRLSVTSLFRSRRFVALAGCGALLALATISDAFVYLTLQKKSSIAAGYFPLLYVATAAGYMLFSIPAGRLADRTSRPAVFLGGYLVLIVLYALLLLVDQAGPAVLIGSLALLGIYYAATEGILMALASASIPPESRTGGMAIIGTGIGLGKLVSSVAFGALWQHVGLQVSITVFAATMAVALMVAIAWLRATDREASHEA